MKRIGLALIFVNMAVSAMAVELEKVDLKTLGAMDLPTVSIEGIKERPVTFPEDQKDWKHVVLQSADKTGITVDYILRRLESDPQAGDTAYVFADPVWINVYNSAFNGSEKVTAEISGNPKETIELAYAGGGRFTGKAGRSVTLLFHHHGVDYPYVQELSVKIDGKLLQDPVSGKNRFIVGMLGGI